jgi:hypothetical protein
VNDGDVQPAVAELRKQPLADRDGAVEHDSRVLRLEGGQGGRDQLLRQRSHPDAQHPGASPAHAAHMLHGVVHLGQQAPGVSQELAAGVSELDTAAGTLQQLHAERSLQLGDGLRQAGLGDVQAARRAAEVQLLRDADEVPQVPELHLGAGSSGHRARQHHYPRRADDLVARDHH